MQSLRLLLVLVLALSHDLSSAGPKPLTSPTPSSCPTPIIEYALPEMLSGPTQITSGSDGNIYFVGRDAFGRITPQGQVSVAYSPREGILPDMTLGSDGNLWITGYTLRTFNNWVQRLTSTGENTTFFPSGNGLPENITNGPDDNLWFTKPNGGLVGRITPQGSITQFYVGSVQESSPWDITSGPDGNLWFTNQYTSTIRQITPGGELTPLIVRTDEPSSAIVIGSDDNLWFTQPWGVEKIVRLSPSGNMTAFDVPAGVADLNDIALGSDGNLWFATDSNSIGRITPAGIVTEVPIPTTGSDVRDIASGPDGNIWFTQANTNKIAKVILGRAHCAFMPLIHLDAP
jgi:streptogramin lyase